LTKQVIEKCNCRTFNQYWAADSAPECSLEQMRNCSSPLLAKLEQDVSIRMVLCLHRYLFSKNFDDIRK